MTILSATRREGAWIAPLATLQETVHARAPSSPMSGRARAVLDALDALRVSASA
jgi:hypothetical protein